MEQKDSNEKQNSSSENQTFSHKIKSPYDIFEEICSLLQRVPSYIYLITINKKKFSD